MATLFDLSADAEAVMSAILAIEEADLSAPQDLVEVPDELYGQLEALAAAIGDKVDSIGYVWTELQSQADALKAEEHRLSEKRKARENGVKRLRNICLDAMQRLGEKKLAGQIYSITRQASPPSCREVDEAAALAAGLAEEVTTVKVDSRGIIAAWKSNPAAVDGIAEVVQGENVRLR
ncbi:MAG: hypothetical protein MOGMAGMI_02450 [Candidatus Omnitrophica bacterium]|nr:hypothetical protein [Candidatus Omnitrophota bacterium]